MSDATGGYRFLSGAEMEPQAILEAYPDARFVARARLSDIDAGEPATEVWGIVIRLAAPDAPAVDSTREVTTDDGRTLRVAIDGDGQPAGEPAAVLAAAKYWELPPAYVKGLMGAG
jgi:hypothetical protein